MKDDSETLALVSAVLNARGQFYEEYDGVVVCCECGESGPHDEDCDVGKLEALLERYPGYHPGRKAGRGALRAELASVKALLAKEERNNHD